MITVLKVQDVGVRYGNRDIVQHINFEVNEGEWLMIVGPNGAGKSTLINAIAQGTDYEGHIFFNQKDVSKMRQSQIALCMGVLLQNHHVGYSFTVEEVVNLGRYAHSHGIFSAPGEEDLSQVEYALQLTGMSELRKQSILTLSGGELQRTFLAQLLAQNPPLLILDEPANHLDLIYQKQVFELISKWVKQAGRSVISVVHDLSLAKAYGTHALLMDKGMSVAYGEVTQVLNRDNLHTVYAMDVYSWLHSMMQYWQ